MIKYGFPGRSHAGWAVAKLPLITFKEGNGRKMCEAYVKETGCKKIFLEMIKNAASESKT